MRANPDSRFGPLTVVVVALFLLCGTWTLGGFAFVPWNAVPTVGSSQSGAGLLAWSTQQTLSGTPFWETYCGSLSPQAPCADSQGITYVAPAGLMVVTDAHSSQAPAGAGRNSIVEFDPVTLQNLSELPVDCFPGVPFYPGNGSVVLVPCTNGAFTNFSVLEFDYATNALVATIPVPIWISSIAVDTQSGSFYGAGWNSSFAADSLVEFNPSPPWSVRETNVPGADFTLSIPSSYSAIVFDPLTARLILPSSGDSVLSMNPLTGTVTTIAELPSTVASLAIDTAADDLFATTTNPSTAVVLNAADYDLKAQISISNCVDNICAVPNDVNQVLADPSHGDAYLVSTTGLIGLNLSTLSTIGAIEDYGDGPQLSSAYFPAADRVFGTYEDILGGPGFFVQLSHGTYPVLTRLLWLSVPLATLALSLVAAAICFAVALRYRRPPPSLRANSPQEGVTRAADPHRPFGRM